MAKRLQSQTTADAIAELQVALDMQDAAEKLVSTKLARLATLLSTADLRRANTRLRRQAGPTLVVSNAPPPRPPISNNAA